MRVSVTNRKPSVSIAIDTPAAAVWDVITDLDLWPVWGPTVSRAELDGDGPLQLGSQGRVWTPVGVPLPFTITEFVDGRAWGWRIGPMPATHHEVLGGPDGRECTLRFSAPIWAPAYLAVLGAALPRIRDLARQR